MYKHIPQGFIATGDICIRQYDEIVKDIPRKVKCVDDTLHYDNSIEQLFYHTWEVKCVDDTLLYDNSIEQAFYYTWYYLYLCASNGIVINQG